MSKSSLNIVETTFTKISNDVGFKLIITKDIIKRLIHFRIFLKMILTPNFFKRETGSGSGEAIYRLLNPGHVSLLLREGDPYSEPKL